MHLCAWRKCPTGALEKDFVGNFSQGGHIFLIPLYGIGSDQLNAGEAIVEGLM